MANVFGPKTLAAFEAASASIPMRQLDRAFDGAGIRLGNDPGGADGARRVQFRRYVASIDQRDAKQRGQLGAVLGALIDEVAESKQPFLIEAAAQDGFAFANGAFTEASTKPEAFALASVTDFAALDDIERRLHVLANGKPFDAIAGASQLVASAQALDVERDGAGSAKKSAAVLDASARRLCDIVASMGAVPKSDVTAACARMAVGAAVTFATFVAGTQTQRTKKK